MPRKPKTRPDSLRPEGYSDPRVYKKTWLKGVFLGNKEAYEDFLTFWDEAIQKGATYTYVVAMIEFRKYWVTDSEGYWVRRLQPEE
jgi:hypothetical protein